MRLVPRQLQIHGLTGDVPYFGGRLTPAQAYAASQSRPPAPGSTQGSTPPGLVPVGGPRGAVPPVPVAGASRDPGPIPGIPPSVVPQAAALNVPSTMRPTQVPSVFAPATAQPPTRPGGGGGGAAGPQSQPGSAPGATARPESQRAIQQLLLAGIITSAEADQLSGRVV